MTHRSVFLLSTVLTLACGDKPSDSAEGTAGTTGPGATASPGTTTAPTSTTPPGTDTGGEPTASTGAPPISSGTGDDTTGASTTSDDTTTAADETTGCFELPLPETTTDPSTTNSSDTGGPCPDPEGQPQSAECTDASGCGCASGKCFLIPILGGYCGECLDDDDCPGGCTIPNPIAGVGATCNLGGVGAGCNEDVTCLNSCASRCGTVLSVPGILEVSTCGECKADADCKSPGKPNCSPVYDIPNFAGGFSCLPDASVPNNGGCALTDDGMGQPLGNNVCMSGKCGEATVMGLLKVGICGECNSNADCPMGQSCTDPVVDLEKGMLVGATCV